MSLQAEVDLLKIAIPLIAASAGGAWAGVRMALNGMRKSVDEVKGDVKDARAEVQVLRGEVYTLRLAQGLLHGDLNSLKQHLGPS